MKRLFVLMSAAILLAAFSQFAVAGTVSAGLADWCVNVNGDTNTACSGVGNGGGAINLAGFDTLLEPNLNSLGTITVSLAAGLAQYAIVYMDYDLNYLNLGSFLDEGSPVGALGPGFSYELDDPNASNIFGDFTANALTDTNNVGSGVNNPPMTCCDVSWALGVNVDVPISATVTFRVSPTAPASGFYLMQSHLVDGETIYLSATVVQQQNGGTVPEPATIGLLLSGGMLLAWKRFRPAR